MSFNPAIQILGPAYVFTRNKAFYSKGNIQVTPRLETFDVELASVGRVESRESNISYEVRFTPVGRLDALSVLWPYGIVSPGELVHAMTDIVSVATGTEVITVRSTARFRDGAPVRVKPVGSGVLPTGLSASTLYYAHVLSSTTLSLHDTEAHALANTDAIDITAAGTGLSRIIEQEYLKIIDRLGTQHLFHNSAVISSPDIIASAAATAIGDVVFECFRAFDTAPTNAASIYTKSTGVTLDTSFDPEDIITEAYSLAWGASAPWDAIHTRAGGRVSFRLDLDPVGNDSIGTISRRIQDASAELSAAVIGISEDDINAKLLPQGAGAGRGRRRSSSDDLILQSTTAALLYVRLYGAVLEPNALNWDRTLERVGELTWRPTRTFDTGVANPLYYVGASAPA